MVQFMVPISIHQNIHIDIVWFLQQISCKCSGGSDAHATTVALFNTLSSYMWDAKVVIALAAFSVNYGEFWLVAQLYPSNPLGQVLGVPQATA